MDYFIYIFLAFIFLMLNAIYNGAETGLVALDIDYLRSRSRSSKTWKKEKKLLVLAEKPERYLAVILIAVNSTFVIGTSLFTATIEELQPSYTEAFSIILSIVLFIFCQFIPKMAFNHRPLKTCLKFLPFLYFADRLFSIPVKVVSQTTRAIMKLFNYTGEQLGISREELVILLGHAVSSGTIRKDSDKMARGIISMKDTSVKEVMIPRRDIMALDVNTPVELAKEKISKSGFSRVPVYKNEIDRVTGILYFKDLFLKRQKIKSINDIISRPMFVPETKSAIELFREMRARSVHMAVVVDEFASLSGIVSFEDLLEEVVGEIYDEKDKPVPDFDIMDNGSINILGTCALSTLQKELQMSFEPVNGVSTINGLIQSQMGKIPEKGDRVEIDSYSIEILDADRQKIILVNLKLIDRGKKVAN